MAPSKKSKVATFLTYHIDKSGKTHLEIATEAGFPKPNVISMMKQGHLKLPLARIPAMAAALDVDAKVLFMTAVEEYMPEMADTLKDILDSATPISTNERKILDVIRKASGNTDPAVTSVNRLHLEKFASA